MYLMIKCRYFSADFVSDVLKSVLFEDLRPSNIFQAKKKPRSITSEYRSFWKCVQSQKIPPYRDLVEFFITSISTATTSTLMPVELFQQYSTTVNMSHIAAHMLRMFKLSITIYRKLRVFQQDGVSDRWNHTWQGPTWLSLEVI